VCYSVASIQWHSKCAQINQRCKAAVHRSTPQGALLVSPSTLQYSVDERIQTATRSSLTAVRGILTRLRDDVANDALLAVPAAKLVAKLRAARVPHQHLEDSLLLFISCGGRV
jgi:hypothetical protein